MTTTTLHQIERIERAAFLRMIRPCDWHAYLIRRRRWRRLRDAMIKARREWWDDFASRMRGPY